MLLTKQQKEEIKLKTLQSRAVAANNRLQVLQGKLAGQNLGDGNPDLLRNDQSLFVQPSQLNGALRDIRGMSDRLQMIEQLQNARDTRHREQVHKSMADTAITESLNGGDLSLDFNPPPIQKSQNQNGLLSTKSQAYVPNSIYTVVPDVEM